jgi:hypothetical protein
MRWANFFKDKVKLLAHLTVFALSFGAFVEVHIVEPTALLLVIMRETRVECGSLEALLVGGSFFLIPVPHLVVGVECFFKFQPSDDGFFYSIDTDLRFGFKP